MADKDKQPQQKDFDKAFENMKAGKGRLPYEDDMSPLPTKEEADKNKDAMQKAMLKGATEGMGGKKLGMKKGGKVSQLAKANGIAVRGKSRGKIC
jgi:hypothetical protein